MIVLSILIILRTIIMLLIMIIIIHIMIIVLLLLVNNYVSNNYNNNDNTNDSNNYNNDNKREDLDAPDRDLIGGQQEDAVKAPIDRQIHPVQFPSQYFPSQDFFQGLGCPETFV